MPVPSSSEPYVEPSEESYEDPPEEPYEPPDEPLDDPPDVDDEPSWSWCELLHPPPPPPLPRLWCRPVEKPVRASTTRASTAVNLSERVPVGMFMPPP
ncbi:hypothetical protein ACE1SV_27820 [Streptomyces sp. E-15]